MRLTHSHPTGNAHYFLTDFIEYRPFCGDVRQVLITEIHANIKGSGKAGFAGTDTYCRPVWGYDHQIIRVIPTTGIAPKLKAVANL